MVLLHNFSFDFILHFLFHLILHYWGVCIYIYTHTIRNIRTLNPKPLTSGLQDIAAKFSNVSVGEHTGVEAGGSIKTGVRV